MKLMRTACVVALALFAATRAWAQAYDDAGPRELYHAEVCNAGQIAVEVAVAYKDFGLTDEFWIIDYWYQVAPGKCKLVYSHFYAPNNLFSFQSFPLYLAFAFTDSTGVWGAAMVRPARDTVASRLHLCLGRKNYKYRVDGKNPEAKCPKSLPVPASFVWEPTKGVYPNAYSREYPPPKRFTVALGPNDRAIAVGAQSSAGGTPQGPGTLLALHEVLKDIMRGTDAPKVRMPNPKSLLEICVSPALVKRESWANPPTARTKAFKETVRQFLASHSFSNGSDGIVRVRVTETGSSFKAEEVMACPGDSYLGLSWRPATQAAVTPPPAATPTTPQPAPGFGDLMGRERAASSSRCPSRRVRRASTSHIGRLPASFPQSRVHAELRMRQTGLSDTWLE